MRNNDIKVSEKILEEYDFRDVYVRTWGKPLIDLCDNHLYKCKTCYLDKLCAKWGDKLAKYSNIENNSSS